MKTACLPFLFTFFLFFQIDGFSMDLTKPKPEANIQKDSTSWIENFRVLRNAIYQHDKVRVKAFFDFPILNYQNEIWDLVHLGTDSAWLSAEKERPFTEKDFDKYFDKLFTKSFVKALLKVKTEELYRKNETETVEMFEGKNTMYHIHASFDKSENMLQLLLSSKTFYDDDNDGEFAIGYQFKVLQNGQIKFMQVRLAG